MSTGKHLTRIALAIIVVGLLASMVLGYSGNDGLAVAGNVVFFLTAVPGVLLLVAGWVVRWRELRGGAAR